METAPEISEGIAAGLGVGYAIILLAGVGLLICGIMVGVKILKREGAGLGVLAIVLAIFCGLATLIWGWVKVKDYGIKKLMLWYTAAFVAFILGYVVMLSAGAGAIMSLGEEIELEMQGAMEEAMEEAMREAEAEAVEGGASQ